MAATDGSLRELGPYSIVRLLGRGATGLVYEATHRKLGKLVAIKVLHADAGRESRASARFAREARAAAQLRHPNVVNVLDAGEDGGHAFIVMDLVEGPSLEEWLREHGPMDLAAAVDVFLPLASAVCAAHDAGVIHRDLKPGNVMVARDRAGRLHPVVVDFGISKVLDEQDLATRSEAILGTLPYLAPELARSASAASPHSDQYALGVMLYECVTGRRPFGGTSPYEILHAIVTTSPEPPSAVKPLLSPDLDAIILRAMAREPDERFPSVQALASALLSFGSRRAWAQWGAEFAGAPVDSGGTLTDADAPPERPARPDVSSGPAGVARRIWGIGVPLLAAVAGVVAGAVIEARLTKAPAAASLAPVGAPADMVAPKTAPSLMPSPPPASPADVPAISSRPAASQPVLPALAASPAAAPESRAPVEAPRPRVSEAPPAPRRKTDPVAQPASPGPQPPSPTLSDSAPVLGNNEAPIVR